ncbi:MAG: sensor histidine kinase [Bryobacteraceae bacterium]
MGPRSRVLLIGTLGGLLLLTLLAGCAGLIIFGRIRAAETKLRALDFERSGALEQVRRAIYLSGTIARDYFADPDGPDGQALLDKNGQLEAESKQAFVRYTALGPAADVSRLQGEVAAWWKVVHLMTEMAWTRRTAGVDAYFRVQVGRRREIMLSIADEIGAALRSERWRREEDLVRMYAQFRLTLGVGVVLLVVLGSAAATFTARRLLRLEAETRALSAQLVEAQEQERRSIARELHDEVGQSLAGLLLDIGAAASDAGQGPVKTRLNAIAVCAARLVEEVRRIALSLRPSMLDDLGLVPALEWQAREVGQRSGIAVEVEAEESAGQLPEALRTCIYRVAQEALRNSVRHSAARRVRIGLSRDAGFVRLRVEDDGRGFAADRRRGLGLLGMQERVVQLGGRFRVLSSPGSGTTVAAELPL